MRTVNRIKKILFIMIGAAFYGAGISLFIDPNDFAPGGISGLSIILNRVIPLDTGTLFLLINIPIMIFGAWKFGKRFILRTLFAIVLVSFFTNLFIRFKPLTTDPMLAAVFGGGVVAIGIGMVLRSGATTGGTDVIIKYLRIKKPYLRTGTLFLIFDAVIIGTGWLVFQNLDVILYSAVSAMVTSQVLDLVLYGKDEANLIYIISDVSEKITNRILEEMQIGVTHLQGSGGYRRKDKQIILCVVKKQSAYRIEEIVKQEDEKAFMIVTSASEIYGEGYKSYFGEKL
ncbi:MAG: YitT family protein [Suilimivivens sp.]|nr:YitT family protein [Lachnospiraceae bacterium]MDY5869767.1 YitT family protein [Lachnospiraceae bacterium]